MDRIKSLLSQFAALLTKAKPAALPLLLIFIAAFPQLAPYLPNPFPSPAAPVAPPSIAGPTDSAPGRACILDATAFAFANEQWVCLNGPPVERLDGHRVLWTCDQKGAYFFAVVGQTKAHFWRSPTVGFGTHKICVKESTPPGPGPKPPTPDAFVESLQKTFDADASLSKKDDLAAFKAFYERAATAALDTAVTTFGSLFDVMDDVAKEAKLSGKLAGVQGVIQTHLKKVLSIDPDKPLDSASRAIAKDEFLMVAKALGGVKYSP